ncbi:VOC family protein, partial [Glaesserella parasuis]
MPQVIGQVSVAVRDYDEALRFYVGALGFVLIEDTALSEGKRWVTVAPGGGGVRLLL